MIKAILTICSRIFKGGASMYISYKDLEIEQKRDLDYKISKSVEAIASGLEVCKHRPAIAFSGGKDSTVLWHLIRTYFPDWNERFVIIYGKYRSRIS